MANFQKSIFWVIFLVFATPIFAQPSTQIDLIFDASSSMWGQIEGISKIEIARDAMGDLLSNFEKQEDIQLALRIYGHLNKKCDNSVVEIPMGSDNCDAIRAKLNAVKPLGKTPIGYSLEQATNDFIEDADTEKIIILITDGIESCDADICAISKQLKEAGIVSKMYIVGFGLDDSQLASLECVVQPFGGEVIGAGNAHELTQAFHKVVKNTYSHNLEIRATDDDGKIVLVSYVITDKDDKVVASGDNSLSDLGKVSVAPGTYNVIITNNYTADEVKLSGIEITKDDIVKKEVIFAERIIDIKVVDKQGNSKLVDVYLYDQSGNEIKFADTSMGGQVQFRVLPGIYSVKLDDYQVNKQIELEDINLIETKEYKKEVIIE